MSKDIKNPIGKNVCFILGVILSLLLEIVFVCVISNNITVYNIIEDKKVEILDIDYEEGTDEDGTQGWYFYIKVKSKYPGLSGASLTCYSSAEEKVWMERLGVYDQIEDFAWVYMLGYVTFAPPYEEVTATMFASREALENLEGDTIIFYSGACSNEKSLSLKKLGIK